MQKQQSTRRTFLMHSATAAGTAAALSGLDIGRTAWAGGSDVIKIGLVGCGGRGTGAAEQALSADSATRLVAMADAFEAPLEISHGNLKGSGSVGDRVEVPKENRFAGFDAYKAVVDLADVVVLATPPGFRPIHFAHAVEQGKHCFVEKPMAVDGPGLRMFLEAAKKSKEKGLSAVHGFCWRYHKPRVETMQKVFDGAIGDVVAIETTYNSQGVWEPRKSRDEVKNEMEYQMWNWYYWDWLSGDHIVEQAIHGIDTINWVMGETLPERVWGVGGRQARTDAKYGNIWDHFSVVFEFPKGVRAYHQCKHWPNTATQVRDYVLCADGRADVFGNRISGKEDWRFKPEAGVNYDMYQSEHNAMYEALRSGKPLNNIEVGARSTLYGLMARSAAYSGQVITPEMVMESQVKLVPDTLAWGEAPVRPVPVPGVTGPVL